MLEHQQIQQLQQLSLQNNDGDLLVCTGTTSLGSPFKPAKRNVMETQRRMSRRASGIAFDLVQAQNDAILQQKMELADKKAEMYARLKDRLKNRQLVDDNLASRQLVDENLASRQLVDDNLASRQL